MRFRVLRVCQSNGFSIVPQEALRYDLERAAALLEAAGHEVMPSEVMVTALKDGLRTTLYTNGRLMVQPVESREYAKQLADAFYALIEGAREA